MSISPKPGKGRTGLSRRINRLAAQKAGSARVSFAAVAAIQKELVKSAHLSGQEKIFVRRASGQAFRIETMRVRSMGMTHEGVRYCVVPKERLLKVLQEQIELIEGFRSTDVTVDKILLSAKRFLQDIEEVPVQEIAVREETLLFFRDFAEHVVKSKLGKRGHGFLKALEKANTRFLLLRNRQLLYEIRGSRN